MHYTLCSVRKLAFLNRWTFKIILHFFICWQSCTLIGRCIYSSTTSKMLEPVIAASKVEMLLKWTVLKLKFKTDGETCQVSLHRMVLYIERTWPLKQQVWLVRRTEVRSGTSRLSDPALWSLDGGGDSVKSSSRAKEIAPVKSSDIGWVCT